MTNIFVKNSSLSYDLLIFIQVALVIVFPQGTLTFSVCPTIVVGDRKSFQNNLFMLLSTP